MHTNYSEQHLQSLLSKVRVFNSHIGDYQHHTFTTASEFVIRLTNGTIYLSTDELEADQKRTLTPELLTAISERFQPSHASAYFRDEETQAMAQSAILERHSKSDLRSWIILFIIVLVIIITGVLISKVLKPSSAAHHADSTRSLVTLANEVLPETEAELMADLQSRERENPLKYLSINWDTRENMLSERLFEGSIYNEANTTGFMNIRVRISGYSSTNYLIDERDYVISEFIDAGDARSFKWQTEPWPTDISHFDARIIRAEWY